MRRKSNSNSTKVLKVISPDNKLPANVLDMRLTAQTIWINRILAMEEFR